MWPLKYFPAELHVSISMSIKKIYIERQVAESPEVSAICRRLNLPFEIVANPQEVYDIVSRASDPVREGKRMLFLSFY